MKHTLLIAIAACVLLCSPACAQRLPPGGGQNRPADRYEERAAPRDRDLDEDDDGPAPRVIEDPILGTADALGTGEVEETQGVVSEQERMMDAQEAAPPKTKQVAPSKVKSKAKAKSKKAKFVKGKKPGKAVKASKSGKKTVGAGKGAGKKSLKPPKRKPAKKPARRSR